MSAEEKAARDLVEKYMSVEMEYVDSYFGKSNDDKLHTETAKACAIIACQGMLDLAKEFNDDYIPCPEAIEYYEDVLKQIQLL